ncbi:MAG: hypothetical protein HY696_10295 [Deltaproteobacteria bacterium]|nr:hypothetical protein [Deltaproteobacteria bacterium]
MEYVLIGGFAVILYGLGRFTKDVDLLVNPSVENMQRIKRALQYLPDNAIALVADDDVLNYGVVRVGDEILIDLLGKACAVDFQQVQRVGMEHVEVDGVQIPIPSKAVLIDTKDTYRASDRADVAFLRALMAEEQKSKP